MIYRYYKEQGGSKVLVIGCSKTEIEKFHKQDMLDGYLPTNITVRKYNTFEINIK